MPRARRGRELARRLVELRPEAQVGSRPLPAERKQRLQLRLGQPGEVGAVAVEQVRAAARPPVGRDRNARRAQRVQIAKDRAPRNLEARGQVAGAQPAVGLQQQEDGKEAVGSNAPRLTRRW